jgi:hypothetical protein
VESASGLCVSARNTGVGGRSLSGVGHHVDTRNGGVHSNVRAPEVPPKDLT